MTACVCTSLHTRNTIPSFLCREKSKLQDKVTTLEEKLSKVNLSVTPHPPLFNFSLEKPTNNFMIWDVLFSLQLHKYLLWG